MVYLDFFKAFDKVDHGILLHKLRAVGITGNIGFWLFHILGPLLFLIMISDIDKDVSASKLVSFADNTRLYSGVGDITDCDNL